MSLSSTVWVIATNDDDHIGHSVLLLLLIPGIIGLSMFEANAIQFGMDQLLEASSEQLSSFIHWYYWLSHVGHLVFGYINLLMAMAVVRTSTDLHLPGFSDLQAYIMGVMVTAYNSIWLCLCVAWALVLYCFRKDFYIQRTGINPLKMVYKVLS